MVPNSYTAADADDAAMLPNNSLAYPKAQSCPFGILGAEKRLKEPGHVGPRDARSIVGYRDLNPAPFLPIMRLPHANRDNTAGENCFQCVQNQVGKHLPQFTGKSPQLP